MALTPDDVVNKTFQPTKFREGYDQDEVDDFLDEVVNALRALEQENADLKAKLSACENRVGELTRAARLTIMDWSPRSRTSNPRSRSPVPKKSGPSRVRAHR